MAKSTPARTKKTRGARSSRATRAVQAADAANAWRQRVSKDAAETVDTVVAHVEAVAGQQLAEHGAFPAFLVTAHKDGEFELDTLPAELAEQLSPEAALAALREKAAQVREDLLCAAVAFPATLPDRSGEAAVAVEAQHREGESLTVLRPYRFTGTDRSVDFGDATVGPADRWLWP